MAHISRRTAAILVAGCILLALGLRLWTLEALLPCQLEPDGSVIPAQVRLIQERASNRDAVSTWQMYPHLVAYVVSLLPQTARHGDTLTEHLAAAAAPIANARLAVAWLSLLAIPATYWLARLFLARMAALLATFLTATSLLGLHFSQQARPHAPAAAFALLAVVAAVRLRRKPQLRNATLLGVALGLALGALQSGVAAIVPVAVASCLCERTAKRGWTLILISLWIALIAGGLAYLLYPHAPGTAAGRAVPSTLLGGVVPMLGDSTQDVNALVGHGLYLDRFDGSGFFTLGRTLLAFETMTLTAACGALAWAAWRTLRRNSTPLPGGVRRDLWVVLAYALPYTAVLGAYQGTYERFCLQLVPYIACLAAAGWSWIERAAPRPLAAALLFALAAPPLAACAGSARARNQGSDADALAAWIQQHMDVDAERVFLLPGVDLSLARSPEALGRDTEARWTTPWIQYQREHLQNAWDAQRFDLAYAPLLRQRDCVAALENPSATLRDSAAQFAAVPVPAPRREPTLAAELAGKFRAALMLNARVEPIRQSHGGGAAPRPVFDYNFHPGDPIWTWELIQGTPAVGARMELYRLP